MSTDEFRDDPLYDERVLELHWRVKGGGTAVGWSPEGACRLSRLGNEWFWSDGDGGAVDEPLGDYASVTEALPAFWAVAAGPGLRVSWNGERWFDADLHSEPVWPPALLTQIEDDEEADDDDDEWDDSFSMTFEDGRAQVLLHPTANDVVDPLDELDEDELFEDHPGFRSVGGIHWQIPGAPGTPGFAPDGYISLAAVGRRYFHDDPERDVHWEPFGTFDSDDEAWAAFIQASGVTATSVTVSIDGETWGKAADILGME